MYGMKVKPQYCANGWSQSKLISNRRKEFKTKHNTITNEEHKQQQYITDITTDKVLH